MTPLRLQLEERAHDAALNILTGSQFQNEDDNSTSAWTPPIRGDSPTSPLTRLYNSLVMKLGEGAVSHLESRIPLAVKPWWRAPTVTITEGREAAERLHTHIISGADPPLAVYTDGSGIHGKVGAAALAPSIHTQELAYLGKETSTTVYAVPSCSRSRSVSRTREMTCSSVMSTVSEADDSLLDVLLPCRISPHFLYPIQCT
ncbi:hypothetical protein BDFG_07711 [Blastomyces dermatitidis ATCC 26199]|nr:hypothetical protein BDFG_07711 [Blastomyces dermatitidis ATCC 26199]